MAKKLLRKNLLKKYNGGSDIVYKVLRLDLTHYGYTYKLGENTDPIRFDPQGKGKPGGLHFVTKFGICPYLFGNIGNQIGVFRLYPHSRIYNESACQAKTDTLELLKLVSFRKFFASLSDKEVIQFIRQNYLVMTYLSDAQRSLKACMEAVNRDGRAIRFLSDEQKIALPGVCLAAVKEYGDAIKYLTDAERTPEVCLAAVKQYGDSIYYLNDSQRSPEVCMEAVKEEGRAIENLTDAQRTPEVCLAAVKQNSNAIKYLNDSQRTPEVCLAAVKQNGNAIEYLNASQRTPEVYIAAVKQNY